MSKGKPIASATKEAERLLGMSEEELVTAAQGGDSLAFVELSRRENAKLLLRAYRITRNWADAEDVVQEAVVRAYNNLNQFQGKSRFSSWLNRIAINSALMNIRRKKPGEFSLEGTAGERGTGLVWEPADTGKTPEESLVDQERAESLNAAIQSLSPSLRRVVQLQQTGELTAIDIAKALGITVAAVKSRSTRAKARLRRLLS